MKSGRKLHKTGALVAVLLVVMCAAVEVQATWYYETVNSRATSSVSKIVNVYYAPGPVYDYVCVLYEDDQGLKIAYRPTLGGSWISELVDSNGLGFYSDMVANNGDLFVVYGATDATDTIHYLCYKERDFGTNFLDGTWSGAEFIESSAPDYPSITLFQPSSSNNPCVTYGLGTQLKFAY